MLSYSKRTHEESFSNNSFHSKSPSRKKTTSRFGLPSEKENATISVGVGIVTPARLEPEQTGGGEKNFASFLDDDAARKEEESKDHPCWKVSGTPVLGPETVTTQQ